MFSAKIAPVPNAENISSRHLKIVLIGDSGVGKTSLFLKFADDEFSNSCPSTIGVDLRYRHLKLENGWTHKLVIWDTAGQEFFRSICKAYYRGAHGIAIVYDITNKASFDHVSRWMNDVIDVLGEHYSESCILCLVGTKTDMENKRQVSCEQGRALASKHKMLFIETSAKENILVEDLFVAMVLRARTQLSLDAQVTSPPVVITQRKRTLFSYRMCTLL